MQDLKHLAEDESEEIGVLVQAPWAPSEQKDDLRIEVHPLVGVRAALEEREERVHDVDEPAHRWRAKWVQRFVVPKCWDENGGEDRDVQEPRRECAEDPDDLVELRTVKRRAVELEESVSYNVAKLEGKHTSPSFCLTISIESK